ncbi:DNA mismatch repair endonuclease MutL [Novipirellula artificiosorum]|uniref:DNA mismatch repair protein MutL n=1 Tax=Novipirellula artificiosorum TaxID=2528016 RepID=A0A5C6DFB1_9BACT|nr:DNA mismatch repair endonuclease MutL [Novipirellula artificiosorum]TWU34507.1 DNA mismatch repair protein MutL [Novipirellula artificiosorum]
MTATTNPLPTIRQLPPNLVNQIAAGEVIERPASVVKELLENSVDAGAFRIEVTINGGGSELIRISDDGCGMTAEQLPLAVASHATSKLPDEQSLFHVDTLGFRGEALASIGSVSQLTIRSRTVDDDCGSELNVRGGIVESPQPCGCPVGTVMEIRNLFFNTPVRHRFLKTAQTERGHIMEAFTRIALANPKTHFVMTSNDKNVYDLPPTTRWSDRIEAFFGGEIAEALIPIENDDGQIRINGYACDPSVSRGNNRMQYLFLNGRHIRDRSLQHALGEAYRGLLMVGRHPVCFLQMEMPAEMVDVNVHPCKLEVRFTDGGRVYGRLLQTLRYQFLKTNMTHRVGPPPASEVVPDQVMTAGESVLGLPQRTESEQRQEVIHWARTGSTSSMPSPTSTVSPSPFPSLTVPGFRPYPGTRGNDLSSPAAGPPTESPLSSEATRSVDATLASDPQPASGNHQLDPTSDPRPVVCYLGFQVHNRYLVTQDEKGMVVIDQHALHERVLYERIKDKVLGSDESLESQRLLVPEPVSLTPAERTAALDAKETLARIGIEIEDFGGETILVQSYPAMLGKTSPGDMLRTVLESLMSAGKQPDAQDLLNHLLSTIACKAAVKAGDPLTREEITALLEQRDLYQDTHHCPHGRPTALFFSRDELDRMFGRLGPRGRAKNETR